MKKLIRGIVDFRQKVLPGYREMFSKLALGQRPDVLFIACSDSRVVPNLFASTDPGDLFVIRNVGNLIPPCGPDGVSDTDESEAAAVEFAVEQLNVPDIVVCGHSDCGAMRAALDGGAATGSPHLKNWLAHVLPAQERLAGGTIHCGNLAPHNVLSQLNVLQQLEHLRSYPVVKKRVDEGTLRLHGWWFDISKADVYAYEAAENRFVLIDEDEAERLLARLG